MKRIYSILFLMLFTSIVTAQVTKTITDLVAGTLTSTLNATEKTTITNLTLTGSIDARDVKFMRDEMTVLSVLDISGVNINAYNGTGGTDYGLVSYPANEMPSRSFQIGLAGLDENKTLNAISLPNSITSIGYFALCNCSMISEITIPNSVTLIDAKSFGYCKGLKIVRVLNNIPPTLGTDCFIGVNLTGIYVPYGSLATYRLAGGWSAFTSILFEYVLTATTKPVTTIALSTATLNASLDLRTDTPVTAYGFCWNTTGSPTVDDNKIDKGATSTLGAYSGNLTNLVQATKYYVKAFATDGERTIYGSEVTFTTPSIPDAAGVISGTQTVCQGQNSVTYTVPTIAYATSYIWTLPTGATGTSTTNSITLNYAKTAISGNITVKGHNQWGDGSVSTLAITASLLPINAGTISGNASVCQGQNSVNYTVPAIDNATSYTWTLPNGATGTSSTNSININFATSAMSGNITVKGHNDCGDGVVSTLPITVNQLPVITVSDKTVICGGSVSLNATTNYSGSGLVSYQWSPITGLNDATLANPTATVTNDITYTVTINTPNSCSTSKSLSITIIPMGKPEIGMVGVSSDNKNLIAWNKAVSTGIESYYIYRETNVTNVYEKIGTVPYESLSIFVDNQSLPDVQSNKYKLSIFDRHGLESPQSNSHKTMHLAINKGIGNAWNLSWEAYEGFVVSTYNIYRGTTPINLTLLGSTSGSNTQYNDLNAPTGDIYYQLEVISPNTVNPTKVLSSQKTKEKENVLSNSLISYSSSRSNIATNVVSGFSELGEKNKINTYPNPMKNEFRIDFEGGSTFEISNLMGQVVYNGNLIKNTIVQTSNLSSGVYLIKFKTGKTFEYKKIIKE